MESQPHTSSHVIEKIVPLTPTFPSVFVQAFSQFLPLVNRDLKVLVLERGQRDVLEEFRSRGYRSLGIESDPETCKELTSSGFETICESTEFLAKIKLPADIGSVWAGRSFQNLDLATFELQLNIIHLILPDKAPFYFSITFERPQGTVVSTLDDLHNLMKTRGFNIVNEWEESDAEGKKWLSVLTTTREKGGENNDQKEVRH